MYASHRWKIRKRESPTGIIKLPEKHVVSGLKNLPLGLHTIHNTCYNPTFIHNIYGRDTHVRKFNACVI